MIFLDIILGSIRIPVKEIVNIIAGKSEYDNWRLIITQFRIPKTITTILAGSGLAVTGLLMQSLFRNPLAGPSILGISSGASLGVALFVMTTSNFAFSSGIILFQQWGQIVSAVLGAFIVFMLIIVVASKVRDSISLLIIGIMFGSITTAIVSVLQYFSKPDLVQKFVVWTMGSLASTTWDQLIILSPFILSGILLSIILIKPMNALLLGEKNAEATGVNVKMLRYLSLTVASLIVGALTAFTGPIAFIGLAVPHLVRMLFRSTNHRFVLPGSLLLGALILLICDIVSQVPGNNLVLPINSITALFGAPVVLWIILGNKQLKSSF
jgi:iron complex transport system permease protein